MTEQIIQKIGFPPRDVQVPIWVWYRSRDFQHCRPDFRWARDYANQVCMEIKIPEEQVLLSDFEVWHFVLNDWYYSLVTSEKVMWKQYEDWFDGLTKNMQQHTKEKSWQRIFDVTPRHGEWTSSGESIQGCFWQLKMSQVQRVWQQRKGERTHEIYSI